MEQQIVALLAQFGLTEVPDPSAVPRSAMVYAAIQGSNVITIGVSGDGSRLKALMGASGRHNKKALLSLCSRTYPDQSIRFFAVRADGKSGAKAKEGQMHAALAQVLGASGEVETYVAGAVGYSESMRKLLGDFSERPEREVDMIALVLNNGDVFCSLIALERFRDLATRIFGDFYVNRAKRLAPAPRGALPVPAAVTARNATPAGWHAVTRSNFLFTAKDLEALRDPACLGLWLTIGPTLSNDWIDGMLEVVVPKDEASAGWQYLLERGQKPSFVNSRQFSNGRNLPLPLKAYVRRDVSG